MHNDKLPAINSPFTTLYILTFGYFILKLTIYDPTIGNVFTYMEI